MTDKITIRVSPEVKAAADAAGPEKVRGIIYAGLMSTSVSTNPSDAPVDPSEVLRLSTKVAELEELLASRPAKFVYSPTAAKSTLQPTPFKLLPWDHDDHLRHKWNIFRQRPEDRDAKLKIINASLKRFVGPQ